MKKIIKHLATVGLPVVLCLIITACSAASGGTSSGTSSDTSGGEPPKKELNAKEEQQWTKKYNQYVEYSNWHSGWLRLAVMPTYEYVVGEGEEFEKPEDTSRFANFSDLYDFNFLHVNNAIKNAKDGISFGETDEYMLKNAEDTLELITLYNEIATYYREGEYEKDNFAKSQQYHTELHSLYDRMCESFEPFSVSFGEITLETEAKDAGILKENGFMIVGSANSIIVDIKKIIQFFALNDYEGNEFMDASLDEYDILYNQFLSDIEDLEKYLSDEEQIEKEGLKVMQVTSAKNVLSSALNTMKPLADDIHNLLKAGSYDIKTSKSGKARTGGRYYPPYELEHYLGYIVEQYNAIIKFA